MTQTHIIEHEAMKTTFVLRLLSDNALLAKQVGNACIECIDTMERQLSRHYPGSDIWQVNQMQADQSLFISEDSYECLRLAFVAHKRTGGLFDITLGRQIEHYKNTSAGSAPQLEGQLMIDPERPAIHCIQPGREIDLGGIGKGYTLDRLKVMCLEYGITSALLASGASTQIAFGEKSWPIELQSGTAKHTVQLANAALSASGTGIQGCHIVSPDPKAPETEYERIWLLTDTAAMADAWSTAAMLMSKAELVSLSSQDLKIYVFEDGRIAPLLEK